MANYEGASRTNYVQVKDEKAFLDWANKYGLTTSKNAQGAFAIFPNPDYDDFPSTYYDEELEDDIDINFDAELQSHLVDGEIVVVVHVGHEKLRYLNGVAYAMDNTGRSVSVSLSDVYTKIREEWGKDKNVTNCSY
jgi:hypothetical protein